MSEHILRIENDGPEIRETDFWRSPYAAAGFCFLSFNAGTARLLLPDSLLPVVGELVRAREVIVSRGPWPAGHKPDAFEVLFEDGSDNPYAFHLGSEQVDRLLDPSEHGRDIRCSVWVEGSAGEPQRVVELPGHLRFSVRLPDLRPWSETRPA